MDETPIPFWSGLRWVDVAAVIGALAWLPYIVRFFWRPRITIIPGAQIEIGYTGLGPILNPSLAFRTERRDALVTAVWFEVVHERGQRAEFRGVQLVETPGVTQSTTGESAVHQRTQAAVAVVLTPATIAERKVNCQEANHLMRYEPLIVGFQTAIRRVQNANAQQWQETVLQSPECQALRDFLLNEFFWQTGNYKVAVFAKVAELRAPATATFSFSLNEAQVRLLRGNQQGIDWELRRITGEHVQQPAPPQFKWQWLYPTVKP